MSEYVVINDQPIKGDNAEGINLTDITAQAELGRRFLVEVDYSKTHGTCGDERCRAGLRSGATTIQPRPSVFGGPDVHGLAIGELTGVFADAEGDAQSRLEATKAKINAAGILSGGHAKCAANGGFEKWMRIIAENPEQVQPYAQSQLGETYDQSAMDEVTGNAVRVIQSGLYADWTEDNLVRALGDEAGEAIEVLDDVPHAAVLLERTNMPNMTFDQTAVYNESVAGPGSFEVDDHYATAIEDAVAAGPDAAHKTVLARHAREVIIAAVAAVVPNETIFQADIRQA